MKPLPTLALVLSCAAIGWVVASAHAVSTGTTQAEVKAYFTQRAPATAILSVDARRHSNEWDVWYYGKDHIPRVLSLWCPSADHCETAH